MRIARRDDGELEMDRRGTVYGQLDLPVEQSHQNKPERAMSQESMLRTDPFMTPLQPRSSSQ